VGSDEDIGLALMPAPPWVSWAAASAVKHKNAPATAPANKLFFVSMPSPWLHCIELILTPAPVSRISLDPRLLLGKQSNISMFF
jgi:hypothetical protein